VINVVPGGGGFTAVAAGNPRNVLSTLSAGVEKRLWQPVGEHPHDVALVGISSPKDTNLYQASRALTYLTEAPRPAVREGGWIVLAARCQEGAGEGPAEEEFLLCMRSGSSAGEVLASLKDRDFKAGGQRALLVARALDRTRAMVVGSEQPEVVKDCLFEVAEGPGETVARLTSLVGTEARVLVVPEPFVTLPTLGSA
jgi:nickel-dependent lactate racemase